MNRIVDAAFHINASFIFRHGVSHEDDIDTGAFLAQIGNGSNVFTTDITLKKHQEMLVGNVRSTNLGGILVGIRHTN